MTVDYKTVQYNKTGVGVAIGLGVDFASKVGQLRWLPQDTSFKNITIPIRADGPTAPSQIFEVWIENVVNGSMVTKTQRAVVTISGISNWPQPLFISNMLRIIGAVCGAATAIPCGLFVARFIRSVRREMARGLALGKDGVDGEATGVAKSKTRKSAATTGLGLRLVPPLA